MIDLHLAAAAVHAKDLTNDVSVILLVRGIVVSGRVCSRDEYLENVHQARGMDQLGNSLCPADALEQSRGAGTPDDPLVVPIPDYLYLRDAQTRLPGSVPLPADCAGIYAQIALESVDGVIWGSFTTPPAP